MSFILSCFLLATAGVSTYVAASQSFKLRGVVKQHVIIKYDESSKEKVIIQQNSGAALKISKSNKKFIQLKAFSKTKLTKDFELIVLETI